MIHHQEEILFNEKRINLQVLEGQIFLDGDFSGYQVEKGEDKRSNKILVFKKGEEIVVQNVDYVDFLYLFVLPDTNKERRYA